jgi:hypothetical protein
MEARNGSGAEIEWQLEVQDLPPVLRWLEQARVDGASGVAVGRASSVTHVDTYLDTRDRRLDRAGFTVRIRRAPELPPELTLSRSSRYGLMRSAFGASCRKSSTPMRARCSCRAAVR